MDLLIWICIAAGLIAASAPITGGIRRLNEKELGKYVGKVGLPLPARLREPLVHRIRDRERWSSWTGLAGLLLAIVVAVAARWQNGEGGLVVVLSVTVGLSLGGVLAILTGNRQFHPDAPRVARARHSELGDYLGRERIWTARLAPLVALVAVGVGTVLLNLLPGGRPELAHWWFALAWVSVALTVACLLVTELVARRVLDRPQRAESSLELAWDDVGRAESLQSAYSIPVAFGVLSCFGALVMVGVVATDPAVRQLAMGQTAAFGVGMLMVAAVLVGGLVVPLLGSNARRHVLAKLWPRTDFTVEARERTC